MIKCNLIIGGVKYNVTNDLKNWDETQTSLKRNDFGGVFRAFANEFEFTGQAYKLIEGEYLKNYLSSNAIVVLSVMNNGLTYNEKCRFQLDFTSIEMSGYAIKIYAIDNDLESIIKSNKSQVYDIPVSELSGPTDYLNYDRMILKNSISYLIVPTQDQTEEDARNGIYNVVLPVKGITLPLSYKEANISTKGYAQYFDQSFSTSDFSKEKIFQADRKVEVALNLKFSIKILHAKYDVFFKILKFQEGGTPVSDITERFDISDIESGRTFVIDKNPKITLEKGQYVTIVFTAENRNSEYAEMIFSEIKDISIEFAGRNEPVKIDVINPNKLLNRLAKEMLNQDVTTQISLPINTHIIAAESIRGITGAKIHTSFSKFCDWAEFVFGYVYEIEDGRITFKHRSSFFDSSSTLKLEDINDFQLSINSKLIYSGIEVGYEKKEYDSINGRDEFNTKNSFSTGVKGNDNVLKMISPFRADCYGIEFLASKREETKDNTSDNDVFFINTIRYQDGNTGESLGYNVYRKINIFGVAFPGAVFNASFSPRRMLLANKEFIGACTGFIAFTASEGNADVLIDDISEKEALVLSADNKLLRVEDINISTTGIHPFPIKYNGLIEFENNGYEYQGYISEISENMGRPESTEYRLICRSISRVQ